MTAAARAVCYRFAGFELQPAERRLLAAGAPVDVGPRAFDMLVALVERGGHLVTKGELLERVWPKLVVEEANLHVHVSSLRKILGQHAITTIPGHGYRFTLALTNDGAGSPTSAVAPKHNLPQHSTSFIGREKEIAEVKTLLGRARLLTLTGSGGCGKTRLGIQVAAGQLNSYADGVWLVELASVANPDLVPQSVATMLGLTEERGKSLTQSVTEHLSSTHLLLVLDNAEHLLAACAQLADVVLRQCPQVKLLVTSRERLGVLGESAYRVPGLPVPDPERQATAASLAQYESVQLFVERARLNLPHFALTDENAPAVGVLCYRLDGLPLAIELAAARVRAMSVEAISQRLDQRFRLLTGGSRMAPRRQQTLRTLIDWSYDLLSDAERALLGRVSIFSGGWTLEATEQVCVGQGVDDWEALDLLTSLADKNLLQAEERNGATRYRLLETLRQYARERLLETGEEACWHGRHLAYFLAVAEKAEPHLVDTDQRAWLDQLEAEHDNLRAALAWSATGGGDAGGGLQLAGALWRFWLARGYWNEGRGWLAKLLAAGPGGQAAADRAKALKGAGDLATQQSDYSAARLLFEESLAHWRELGNRRGIAESLNNLGRVAVEQGDYASAKALYEESLSILRELGDRRGIAILLNCLGSAAGNQGDYPVAKALYEESLAILQELGDRQSIAISLINLGLVAYEQGDYPASRALAEDSLAIWRELGDRRGIGLSLNTLGAVAFEQCDYASARALHAESLAIRWELGDRRGVAESLERLAHAESAVAGPGRAARIWGRVERLREEIGSPVTLSERPRYDRQVAAARAAMGDESAFDLAWREGRAMTLDEAVQYAMEKKDA